MTSNKKTVYVSGKITDATPEELEQFTAMARSLQAAGYTPILPIVDGIPTNGIPFDAPWIDHIAEDLKMLDACDAVAFTPSYRQSKGARIEHAFATILGKEIIYTASSSLLKIKQAIEQTIGLDDLVKQSKTMEYFAGRVLLASFCKERGMTHNQTAQVVCRAIGSICNMYKQHEAFMATWPQYRSWRNKVIEQTTKEIQQPGESHNNQ